MRGAFILHLAGLVGILFTLDGAWSQEAAILPDLKGWTYSDVDAEVLKHADIHSAAGVYSKLRVLYRQEGAEAVRAAVPALAYRYFQLQTTPRSERAPGEANGELKLHTLFLLGKLGDPRSESALLSGMRHPNYVADGLRMIGGPVLPAILDSLSHPEHDMRVGAVVTVRNIARADSSFFSQKEMELVRQSLVRRLQIEEDGVVRSVILKALPVFWDRSILPILERVAEEDPFFSTLRKRYTNRLLAAGLISRYRSTREDSIETPE